MAQATVSARIDAEDKLKFDQFCDNIGLTTSAVLNVFIKKVIREQRIPFTIESDRFYEERNLAYIAESAAQYANGQVVVKSLDELEAMENA